MVNFASFISEGKPPCNTHKLIKYAKGIQYLLDSYFIIDAGRSSGPAGRSSGPAGRSSGPSGRSSGLAGRSSGPAGRSSGPAAELFSCEIIVFISLTVTEISL